MSLLIEHLCFHWIIFTLNMVCHSEVCMFSLCLRGFPPKNLSASHCPETYKPGELETLNCCRCEVSVEGLPVLDLIVNLSVKDPAHYFTYIQNRINTLLHAYASGCISFRIPKYTN